jgi:hypothetical protein
MKSKFMLAAVMGFMAVLFVLSGCSTGGSGAPMAETTAAPDETAAPAKTAASAEKAPAEYEIVEHWQTMTVSGVVESVDLATRKVGIRGPKGGLLLIKAGENVERLDEVEVGDEVVAEYHISVVAEFREPTPEEEANPLVFLETAAKAPPGADPAGGALAMIRAVVTIEGIDRPTQTVTVMGPQGNYLVADVLDPTRFDRISIGDPVIVTYTEALGVALEKAEK